MELASAVDAPVGWTPWVIMAGVSAVLAGQAHVLLQLRPVGGGARSILSAIRTSGASFATIVVIDFIGGLALGCAYALLGATQPAEAVTLITNHPVLGWALIGLLGPVLSDRTFAGTFIRGKFDPLLPNRAHPADGSEGSSAWRLRTEAVASLVDSLWTVVRRETFPKYRALKTGVKRAMSAGEIRPSEVVYLLNDFYAHSKSKPCAFLSEQLNALALEDEDVLDIREDSAERLVTVAITMLNDGHWDPIQLLVNAAEA